MNAHARNVQATTSDTGNYTARVMPSSTESSVVVIGDKYYGAIVRSVGVYKSIGTQAPLSARFKTLRERWKRETLNMSAIEDIVLNSAYQEIIGMGPAVIPFIIDELETAPTHWFAALLALSGGDDPVAAYDYGDMDRMALAWIRWAEKRGYR